MKRYVLLTALLFVVVPAFSQGSVGHFNIKDFPTVSFSLKSNNPDVQPPSSFHVFEEGVEANLISATPVEENIPEKWKDILFLWDLRGKESLVPEILHDFLAGPKYDSLKVNVAVFGRDKEQGSFYYTLLDDFTSDVDKVDEAVIAEAGKEFKDKSKSSDIVLALTKSVGLMSALPINEAKAIVLFTVGKNNTDTGIETMPLVSSAKKNRIHIYTVNINGDEAGRTLCENLSQRTYGLYLYSEGSFETREKREAEMARFNTVKYDYLFSENETVSSWIVDLSRRWEGVNYQVVFSSNFDRIGQTKQLSIELGEDVFTAAYSVPGFSLWVWIKGHPILSILLFILFFSGLGIGLFFFIRHLRDVAEEKKEEEEKKEAERKRLKNEQESLKRKLDIAESEQRRRIEEEKKRDKDARKQEYISSINALMRSRNIRARILVSTMTGSFEYIINSAETSIGTADDNDIVIEDRTVSRHHAILYFNGEAFGIKDLKSTNGIVMNGFKMDDMKLRNGDSVSLGNTVIKIYF